MSLTEPKRPLVMTTTNELFLPSRIVYRVADRARVSATFRGLRCMTLEPSGRWTWNYEFEAKKMDFPPAYDEIPRERQPVVLASCYWVEPELLHVYVRSTLRLTKFLVFFDRHVPRNCAQGEFFDEYNLITAHDPRQPVPKPEDYFPLVLAQTECGRPKKRMHTAVHRGAVFYLTRTVHPKLHRAPIRRCGTRLGRELRSGVKRRLDAREGAPLQLGCEICGLAAVKRWSLAQQVSALCTSDSVG